MASTVAYISPFVPPEWITAHGLRPHRLIPAGGGAAPAGACPFAWAFAEEAVGAADAVVLTTTCDPMRRSAEQAARRGATVFLMNVPATWRTSGSRLLYIEELRRLGRLLVRLGGAEPDPDSLMRAMRLHESQRCSAAVAPLPQGTPIALVGGPLRDVDHWVFDFVRQLGSAVVLDATETGERTLPAPFDASLMQADPLNELARAYFDTIPDAFRRPDTMLHDYLRRRTAERGIKGIILLRYVWCDQWHAQLQRIRETTGLPVVEIEIGPGSDSAGARARTRIEALIDIARA